MTVGVGVVVSMVVGMGVRHRNMLYYNVRPMPHDHSHDNSHDHAHHHGHAHSHGPATPHPAQAAPWSILRMTVTARLAAALAVSAALWAVVLVAMR